MIGMKVETICMPPPMPSASTTRDQTGRPNCSIQLPRPSTRRVPTVMSKKSMKAPPMLMVNMNIRYMMKRKMGMPAILFRITLSIRSERVRPTLPRSRSTRPASAWACP